MDLATGVVPPHMSDFNTQVIEEFRANHGKVGGNFAGSAPRAASSGRTRSSASPTRTGST
jgi:hypothetical protein